MFPSRAVGGRQELIGEAPGYVVSDADQEDALSTLGQAVIRGIEQLVMYGIARIPEPLKLLLEEPALLCGDHPAHIFHEKVLWGGLSKDAQKFEVEEVSLDGCQIALCSVLPPTPGTETETGTGVAADEDVGFGKRTDSTHIPDVEVDVGKNGTVGGTGNGIDIVGP